MNHRKKLELDMVVDMLDSYDSLIEASLSVCNKKKEEFTELR